jgi:hypothetical protein
LDQDDEVVALDGGLELGAVRQQRVAGILLMVRAFPSEERRIFEACCGDDTDAQHIGWSGNAQ